MEKSTAPPPPMSPPHVASLCVRFTQWVEPVPCQLNSRIHAPLPHSQQYTLGTVLLICSSRGLPQVHRVDLSTCTTCTNGSAIGASTRQQQQGPTWPQHQQQHQQQQLRSMTILSRQTGNISHLYTLQHRLGMPNILAVSHGNKPDQVGKALPPGPGRGQLRRRTRVQTKHAAKFRPHCAACCRLGEGSSCTLSQNPMPGVGPEPQQE